jgi:hypothetical protein
MYFIIIVIDRKQKKKKRKEAFSITLFSSIKSLEFRIVKLVDLSKSIVLYNRNRL